MRAVYFSLQNCHNISKGMFHELHRYPKPIQTEYQTVGLAEGYTTVT